MPEGTTQQSIFGGGRSVDNVEGWPDVAKTQTWEAFIFGQNSEKHGMHSIH